MIMLTQFYKIGWAVLMEELMKTAQILIIDDEKINLLVLEELLESDGFINLICEHDPVKAIKLYDDNEYDLVLLDLNMPVKTGFDVMDDFAKINKKFPPPILVLTALSDKTTKIHALTDGASDFITKPFDHEEVICRVHNLVKLQLAQKALSNQNNVLEKKVQQRTSQLNDANLDAIYRLGLVADYRDTDTGEHTKRVGRVSQILAQALALDEHFCDMIFHAAPMHDIGKVGIPDSILLKPGKLDADEWEIMQQHSDIGARMLENSPSEILQLAQEIALTHHERWDGKGYPNGTKGVDIPISGRIVIIADVFDALNSDRPYKKAWQADKIKDFMLEQRGLMFDPDIIELFLENLDDIVAVKDTISG